MMLLRGCVAISLLALRVTRCARHYAAPGHHQHHIYSAPVRDKADACAPDSFLPGSWTGNEASRGRQQLFGTSTVQRRLWELMHPQDCRSARYFLAKQHDSGIGSMLHVAGMALGIAASLGRVLVLTPHPHTTWHDQAWCQDNLAFDACYFHPISSCGFPDHILPSSVVSATSWEQLLALNDTPVVQADVTFLTDYSQDPRAWQLFAPLLAASPIPIAKQHYWWRAQSVAYIVRPNARLLEEVHTLRRKHFPHSIAPGTISVHIRRGDKVKETPNTPTAQYLAQAEAAYSGSEGLHRRIFLSTDDPEAVRDFTAASNWTLSYAGIGQKSSAQKSILEYARESGARVEMAESLLNLELALECDAFVCTLSSNWCRLIDELRATVRCKADALYLDAQQSNPPEDLHQR